MSNSFHNLPAGLSGWVESIAGGNITRLERHVARREAWVVDVTASDGTVFEGFLRLDRNPVADSSVSLRREARICEALMNTDIPVPQLHGWNEELHAALFSRDSGCADVDKLDDKAQQRAVMEDFIRIIARLHLLDIDALCLDDILGARPQTPRDCALADLDALLHQYRRFLSSYTSPLLSYGVQWLQRFAPDSVSRLSLVQGDTGPVNFMFVDDRVSVIVDWEWGHWGDPMEDLGNICVREFWNPSGGLDGLFQLYEEESGLPYRQASAQYYRVQQNIRGAIPTHAVCAHPPEGQSLAWYLCYRYVSDRATCEGIADAMGIEVARPEMPGPVEESDPLLNFAVRSIVDDVLPRMEEGFAASRILDAARLTRCAERRTRFGRAVDAIECEEIAELLGVKVADLSSSLSALDQAIAAQQLDDEPLLQYLARRAYREEWLNAPVVELYPDRRWSSLD